MNYRIFLIFFVFFFSQHVGAQSMTLDVVQTRFEEEVGKLDERLKERSEALRQNYLGALLRMESRARSESDLDGVVAAQTEISRVETAHAPLRPTQEAAHPEMIRLQEVVLGQLDGFELTRARDLLNLKENLKRFANNQSMDLTQRGDIDAALAWRNWSEGLEQRADVQSAQHLVQRDEARRARVTEVARADRHAAFQGEPLTLIQEEAEDWVDAPRLFLMGNEPKGSEKRLIESTPSAIGSGHALVQARLRLVDEEDTLGRYNNRWSRFRHRAHLYVARLQLTPLPGRRLDESLVVFDLYKRGSGSTREIIRTDRAILPPIEEGSRVVVDAGVYAYESQSHRTSWGHRSDHSTADEFHGFIVTLFDREGKILYQRSSDRGLDSHARTEPPEPRAPTPVHQPMHGGGHELPPGVRVHREGDQIMIIRE